MDKALRSCQLLAFVVLSMISYWATCAFQLQEFTPNVHNFLAQVLPQLMQVPQTSGTAIALVGTGCSANGTSSTSTGGCQSNGGTGLAVTFTYNGAVAANSLSVNGNANCGGTTLTLTDTGTGTITTYTYTTAVAGPLLNTISIITNISAGAHALTETASGGTCTGNQFVEISVIESSGIATGNPTDQSANNLDSAGTTGPHTSPSITSTTAKSLMIGMANCSGAPGTVSGLTAGWTSGSFLDSTNWNHWYYRISSATETQSFSYNTTNGPRCAHGIVNFKGN